MKDILRSQAKVEPIMSASVFVCKGGQKDEEDLRSRTETVGGTLEMICTVGTVGQAKAWSARGISLSRRGSTSFAFKQDFRNDRKFIHLIEPKVLYTTCDFYL